MEAYSSIINTVIYSIQSIECNCDQRGIRSSAGCNVEDGSCSCKDNVIGRDCNQCKPEHYGLSKDDSVGCQPCDCDIGGATDNNCDVITGQCKCRPNIKGRQCNDVPDGFFIGGLDYLVYEGESATGSNAPVGTQNQLYSTQHLSIIILLAVSYQFTNNL